MHVAFFQVPRTEPREYLTIAVKATHQVSLVGWGIQEKAFGVVKRNESGHQNHEDPAAPVEPQAIRTRHWLLRNSWRRYYANDVFLRARRDTPNNYSHYLLIQQRMRMGSAEPLTTS